MEWLLVGSACWAACIPAQDDWLNDLSLMPPMSVTMQALNCAAVGVLDFGAGLAQPAASTASTLSAATALNDPLTVPPSAGAACRRHITGLSCWPSRPRHKENPGSPPRDDQECITVTSVAEAGNRGG